MSQKFSIVIEVRDGKPITTGYLKADAQKANEHFVKLRDAEKEAYLFQHPLADRRSKSAAQVSATLGERDENGKIPVSKVAEPVKVATELKPEIIAKLAAKKKGGANKIEGISMDAVDIS
jgi:hypothetical protein